jgi:holliday junction DNA helicase RuvB
VVEPYLIQLGLIARTARGRVLNDAGWEHLEMVPPTPPAPNQGGLFGEDD